MNIPDEYWTTEVPEGVDICALKWPSGTVDVVSIHVARVFAREPDAMGACFCRLTPAAEVEKMQMVVDHVCEVRDRLFAERDALKAENEKLRKWVAAAWREGRADYIVQSSWTASTAKARLEGRSE